MSARRHVLPTLLLSLLLIGFCTYVSVRPVQIRGGSVSGNGVLRRGISIGHAEGRVEVLDKDGAWQRVHRGHLVKPGQIIRTGADGRVELNLGGKSRRLH